MRNLPKFANSLGDKHGVALLLHWPSRSTLEIVCQLLAVVLVPRLGGLGCQNFFRFRLKRRELHTQPVTLKVLHCNLSVWYRTRARGGGDSVLYCFRPSVDNPSKPQWGSILLLVRALLSSNWSVTDR